MKKESSKKTKGVSMILVILLLGVVLTMVLAISNFITRQIGILRDAGNALKAFYIADSGIEKFLSKPESIPLTPLSLLDGQYTLQCECVSGDCPLNCSSSINCLAPNFCLKAIGFYLNFNQVLSIDY